MPSHRTTTGLLLLVACAVVGGLLVALPPWLLDGYARARALHPAWGTAYLVTVGLGVLILFCLAVWLVARLWRNTRRRRDRCRRRASDPSQLSRGELEREIGENLDEGTTLADATDLDERVRRELSDRVARLMAKRESQKLEIVAFGSISSGKSSLLNSVLAGRDVFRTHVVGGTTLARSEIPWPGSDRVVLVDTPGLAEVDGEVRADAAALAARDADLVLLVVDGPLRAYESELLSALGAMEKRILVCLGKQDWFPESERSELLTQIREQVAPHVAPGDVVVVRARPAPRRRVRVQSDGRESDESVAAEPDIRELARRMLDIVQRDGRDLLLANLLLKSRGLVDDAHEQVLASLDAAASDIIHRTMWAAGGAVAVNPLPLLDLAGGSAITVKMVLDMARVYGQDVDADTVVSLLAQLAKNLIAMLGVTAATPLVSSAVATTLKTVPGIGTLAGGLIQGLVQAIVTLWIGRVFMAYFRAGMRPPAGGLAELARHKWQEVTRPDELRKLIRAGRRHLAGKDDALHDRT